MVGVIDGFRWSLLRGQTPLSPVALLASVALTLVICASRRLVFSENGTHLCRCDLRDKS
jgi:hypothetical protein